MGGNDGADHHVTPPVCRQVLGGSRGSEVLQRQEQEQESDPEELRKLLKLITDLGRYCLLPMLRKAR